MKRVWFVAYIFCIMCAQNLFSAEIDQSDDSYEKIRKIIGDTATRRIPWDAQRAKELCMYVDNCKDINKKKIRVWKGMLHKNEYITLLHCAMRNVESCFPIVNVLLEHGSDPNVIADDNNESVFHYYCAHFIFKFPELLDAFLKNGADVNKKDSGGIPMAWKILRVIHCSEKNLRATEENCFKKIIQCMNYNSINGKSSNGDTIISYVDCSDDFKYILPILSEHGLNMQDEKIVEWINKPQNLKVKNKCEKLLFKRGLNQKIALDDSVCGPIVRDAVEREKNVQND